MRGLRPKFPSSAPGAIVMLAQSCWSGSPQARPTFDEALTSLNNMLQVRGASCTYVHVCVCVHCAYVIGHLSLCFLRFRHPSNADFVELANRPDAWQPSCLPMVDASCRSIQQRH